VPFAQIDVLLHLFLRRARAGRLEGILVLLF
jgi:hypothetical protein